MIRTWRSGVKIVGSFCVDLEPPGDRRSVYTRIPSARSCAVCRPFPARDATRVAHAVALRLAGPPNQSRGGCGSRVARPPPRTRCGRPSAPRARSRHDAQEASEGDRAVRGCAQLVRAVQWRELRARVQHDGRTRELVAHQPICDLGPFQGCEQRQGARLHV